MPATSFASLETETPRCSFAGVSWGGVAPPGLSRIVPRLPGNVMMLSLVATLLLGLAGPDDVAEAQTDASQPPRISHDGNGETARRMPLRLVKRSQQADRPEDGTRYGRPIELPSLRRSQRDGTGPVPRERAASGGGVTFMVLSSLAIVLGLFFLVVWLVRRALPKSATSLPSDVLEVLGRSPLAARHNLQLIRLGRRLLLVSVTPDAAETLTEVTDVDEVNHLISLCRQNQPGSVMAGFREALHQLGMDGQTGTKEPGSFADRAGFGAGPAATRRAPLREP